MGRHEKRKKKRQLFSAPVEKPKHTSVSFTTFKGKKVRYKRPRQVPKNAGVKRQNR